MSIAEPRSRAVYNDCMPAVNIFLAVFNIIYLHIILNNIIHLVFLKGERRAGLARLEAERQAWNPIGAYIMRPIFCILCPLFSRTSAPLFLHSLYITRSRCLLQRLYVGTYARASLCAHRACVFSMRAHRFYTSSRFIARYTTRIYTRRAVHGCLWRLFSILHIRAFFAQSYIAGFFACDDRIR